ncbi:MAG TPA: hypothetical protein PK513_08380, partial [Alphaproteobacteria bacterium]|nr:hypothetical protein [Alphaproteobacteria bacterium]
MLKHLCGVLVAGVAFVAAPLEGLATDSERAMLETMFKEADIIPDGKLDEGEFDMYHFSAFVGMDSNHDGVLDKRECNDDCFGYNAGNGVTNQQSRPYQKLEFAQTPYRFDAIDKRWSRFFGQLCGEVKLRS